MNFQKLEAKAIFIGQTDELEFEEYEFDLSWSHEKESWVSVLKLGKYLLTAKASGYSEINHVIEITNDSKQFDVPMILLNEGAQHIQIRTSDLESYKPIKNAIVEVWI